MLLRRRVSIGANRALVRSVSPAPAGMLHAAA
jgi:hypothetical protein